MKKSHILVTSFCAIVMCQGRNESALKYKELAFDLNRQGYDLFFIDHRGQGFSQCLGGDKYRAHVNHFQDYIDDLNTYITSLNLAKHYQHYFLLSHSMGGTISALYLEQYKHSFSACILFSPMFSINLGMPNAIAKVITQVYSTINNWFFNRPCYVFNGHGYQTKSFEQNELTSSKLRFTLSNNIFNLRTLDNNEIMVISDAKHEILIEQDQYRAPALNKTLEFMHQIQNNE